LSPGRSSSRQGARAVGFFLVLEGQVEVRRQEKAVAKLGKGQFFGEMALIDDQPRSGDVVAIAATNCFVLSAWSFSALVKTEPAIALGMMKEFVRRLRDTDEVLT
jgi:CRP-like cAMP-binding protein